MFSTVTSWLGGTKPDYEVSTDKTKTETADEKDKGQDLKEETGDKVEKSDETQSGTQMPNIGEVGEKTLNAAKEWGGRLINQIDFC